MKMSIECEKKIVANNSVYAPCLAFSNSLLLQTQREGFLLGVNYS